MRHDSHTLHALTNALESARRRLADARGSQALEHHATADVEALEHEVECARTLAARGLTIDASIVVAAPCAGTCPWTGARGRLREVSRDGLEYLLAISDALVWLPARRCSPE